MKNGGQDFPSDDKFFCRLSSRKERYNSSKQKQQQQGDASFRVLYYGGATGSVPFMWESQPGTPKHKLSDSPLPPLTPPPQYQSSPSLKLKKKHSKIFNSIFARIASKKLIINSPTSPSLSSSSSYSSSSTPLHYGKDNKKARLRSTSNYFEDDDEYDDVGTRDHSPTSTLMCFSAGNNNNNNNNNIGSSSTTSKGYYYYYYYPIKSVKKVMKSIAAGRRH